LNALRQIVAVTLMNLRAIPARWGSSLVICIGIAGVVAVLMTVLAMAMGLEGTLASAGRSDRAIVLSGGAIAEALSTLTPAAEAAIESAPGLAHLTNGHAAVSPEALVSVSLPRKEIAMRSSILVRGLTDAAFEVRPELRIVEGRVFAKGLREIIVGRGAARQFAGLAVGDSPSFLSGSWRVVGIFESNGDVHESEILADAHTLMSAAQRTMYSGATAKLASDDALDAFSRALLADPTLKVEVKRETDYYKEQAKGVGAILEVVAHAVGTIMALGAVFGALNTMYAAVAVRNVEIATLRAVGFGALPVLVSVLIEALALALVGAATGGALAWLLFNGHAFSSGGTFAQIAVKLHFGADLVATGILWAIVIGIIGGLLPAIRAARLPVAASLRAV